MSRTIRKRSEKFNPRWCYIRKGDKDSLQQKILRHQHKWYSDSTKEIHKPDKLFRRMKHKKRRSKDQKALHNELMTGIPGNYQPWNSKDSEIWDWW